MNRRVALRDPTFKDHRKLPEVLGDAVGKGDLGLEDTEERVRSVQVKFEGVVVDDREIGSERLDTGAWRE